MGAACFITKWGQICDFELLATGLFSPLKGFMTQMDYESVLNRMRLESGELWPVPVCLDIPENLAQTLETGQSGGGLSVIDVAASAPLHETGSYLLLALCTDVVLTGSASMLS